MNSLTPNPSPKGEGSKEFDNPEEPLQIPRISRENVESTKRVGEDRHRPRIAKMSDIIE